MAVVTENVRMRIDPVWIELEELDLMPETVEAIRNRELFIYCVIVEEGLGEDAVYLGGPGICVLDFGDWTGVYTVKEIDDKCPGPDANWLADQLEGVLKMWK